MQNWDDLKYCLALDEFRTMTAAAKALGTNTATVSRRIERLTEEAGQPLFTRQNCQWMATTLGQELSAVARRIEERLHAAEINASILEDNYKLHITAPQFIIEACLLPEADQLLTTYPQMEMKLASTHASLAFGETDLILSFSKPEEGRIFRFRIGQLRCGFYHAARFNSNLQGWINVDSETGPHLKLEDGIAPLNQSPRLTVSNLLNAHQLIRTMPLLAYLPCSFADSKPDLMLFEPAGKNQNEIWASYHYTRKKDPVLKLARDWIESSLMDKPPRIDQANHMAARP